MVLEKVHTRHNLLIKLFTQNLYINIPSQTSLNPSFLSVEYGANSTAIPPSLLGFEAPSFLGICPGGSNGDDFKMPKGGSGGGARGGDKDKGEDKGKDGGGTLMMPCLL